MTQNQLGPYTLARLLHQLPVQGINLKTLPHPYNLLAAAIVNRANRSPEEAYDDALTCLPGSLAATVTAAMDHVDLTKPGEGDPSRGVTARELLKAKYPPLRWLVDDLIIRPGLTLLGGAPKVGKSWLSLQIARAVARGDMLFEKRVRASGRVLYYALEDGPARLQSRLKQVGWTGDENVIFLFGDALPPLDDQGFDVLESDIRAFEPALVVCDSFAAAKSARLDENDGGQVAQLMYALSRLSSTHNLALLVVHHHRKAATGSPLADLRGSGALGGAADSILALYRERGEPECKLGLDSRDSEGGDWTLGFTGTGWTLLGGGEVAENIRTERKIVSALRALGADGGTLDQIIQSTGSIRRQVAVHVLQQLVAGGYVHRCEEKGTGGRPRMIYRSADLSQAT